jgi:hypothetical protein
MEADRDHRLKVPGGTGLSIRARTAIGSAAIGSVDCLVVLAWLPSPPRIRASKITRAVQLIPCFQRWWLRPEDLRLHRSSAVLVAP